MHNDISSTDILRADLDIEAGDHGWVTSPRNGTIDSVQVVKVVFDSVQVVKEAFDKSKLSHPGFRAQDLLLYQCTSYLDSLASPTRCEVGTPQYVTRCEGEECLEGANILQLCNDFTLDTLPILFSLCFSKKNYSCSIHESWRQQPGSVSSLVMFCFDV